MSKITSFNDVKDVAKENILAADDHAIAEEIVDSLCFATESNLIGSLLQNFESYTVLGKESFTLDEIQTVLADRLQQVTADINAKYGE